MAFKTKTTEKYRARARRAEAKLAKVVGAPAPVEDSDCPVCGTGLEGGSFGRLCPNMAGKCAGITWSKVDGWVSWGRPVDADTIGRMRAAWKSGNRSVSDFLDAWEPQEQAKA